MLLNEMRQRNAAQDAEIRDLKQPVEELKYLKQQVALLSAVLRKLRAKDELVAQR
jgi:hypothetical protein